MALFLRLLKHDKIVLLLLRNDLYSEVALIWRWWQSKVTLYLDNSPQRAPLTFMCVCNICMIKEIKSRNFIVSCESWRKIQEVQGPWRSAWQLQLGLQVIFCRLVSKTHCCKLNQLKSGLTLTQYLTMNVSILDHIRHLNFDLSGSLKVKCDSVTAYMFSH